MGSTAINTIVVEVLANSEINSFISEISQLAYIENAHPNTKYLANSVSPNPWPFAGNSWVEDINLMQAWNYIYNKTGSIGDPLIKIGVIDDKVVENSGHFSGKNIVEISSTISSSAQSNHGTAVAAIAAAKGDDGHGMAGVAWDCPVYYYDGYIHNLFIEGYFDSTIRTAVARLIREGVRVVNISVGYNFFRG